MKLKDCKLEFEDEEELMGYIMSEGHALTTYTKGNFPKELSKIREFKNADYMSWLGIVDGDFLSRVSRSNLIEKWWVVGYKDDVMLVVQLKK